MSSPDVPGSTEEDPDEPLDDHPDQYEDEYDPLTDTGDFDLDEFMRILEGSSELVAVPGTSPDSTEPATVEARLNEIKVKDDAQTVTLKKWLAGGSFAIVGLQILLANVALFWYAFANDWDIDTKVMLGWMATTVLETIGIVYVIAQHLFPSRDE